MSSATALAAPLIETLEVTPVRCDSQLAGRGIETPEPDTRHDAYSLTISGWVYASPAAPSHVHVVSEGHVLASAAVSFPRPDVAAHLAVAGDVAMGFLTD